MVFSWFMLCWKNIIHLTLDGFRMSFITPNDFKGERRRRGGEGERESVKEKRKEKGKQKWICL